MAVSLLKHPDYCNMDLIIPSVLRMKQFWNIYFILIVSIKPILFISNEKSNFSYRNLDYYIICMINFTDYHNLDYQSPTVSLITIAPLNQLSASLGPEAAYVLGSPVIGTFIKPDCISEVYIMHYQCLFMSEVSNIELLLLFPWISFCGF